MHRIERRFPGMAKRRVSEIVAKRNGFGQILIQIQRPRNRAAIWDTSSVCVRAVR